MLRTVVLTVAFALIAGGIWLCIIAPVPKVPGLYMIFTGAVVVLGTLFERWRYRKRSPPDAQWHPTGERFIDPQSGADVEVLYDPETGERRYAKPGSRHDTFDA